MESFFEQPTEQSRVKTAIVANYFKAWADVMISVVKRQANGRIAYVDLFAGPGRYSDGTPSTPLIILEKAINDPDLRQALLTVFNDKNSDHCRNLETAIASIEGIQDLRFKPQVSCHEIGEDIVKEFEKLRKIPTLTFIDPWGYKGLSLRLINAVMRNWGCDCIFFFNYNRISMGLPNEIVDEHMDCLFGQARAENLRQKLKFLESDDRELTILEELAEALQELGGEYVLPFSFLNNKGTRTSHHLIFVSKHVRGYQIMKDIMARQSSMSEQGVPTFRYCRADRKYHLLFELSRPLEDLEEMLLNDFVGQTLSMEEIFERHNVGRPYIRRNYKEVLMKLEKEEKIVTSPRAVDRKSNTFGPHVRVFFPGGARPPK